MTTTDFAVIGGGVLGVNIASEIKRRFTGSTVLVLEKEHAAGLHASGRNSGVLHAGFYYTADSLKARFTRLGNQRMKAYCDEKRLRVNRCGKLVVAQSAAELEGLAELLRRGRANGVVLEEITESEARKIEPRVRTFEKAIFSPDTACVDPAEMMRSFVEDAERLGVRFLFDAKVLGRRKGSIVTGQGDVACGYVVNAGGLHADKIARDYGFSQGYRILPFKGLYVYSNEPAGAFKTNIYPVPNLGNPFLGVHVTVMVDGRAKIGPTAIPCLWREQYHWHENFDVSELVEVAAVGLDLFLRAGSGFRRLAVDEMKKYHRPRLVAEASRLADGVRLENYTRWGRAGIRAQLVDVKKKALVQDFCVESDDHSLHVLNAVSPGWTCAIPFSEFVCDEIDRRIHGKGQTERRSA